jgi:hypothetical protein
VEPVTAALNLNCEKPSELQLLIAYKNTTLDISTRCGSEETTSYIPLAKVLSAAEFSAGYLIEMVFDLPLLEDPSAIDDSAADLSELNFIANMPLTEAGLLWVGHGFVQKRVFTSQLLYLPGWPSSFSFPTQVIMTGLPLSMLSHLFNSTFALVTPLSISSALPPTCEINSSNRAIVMVKNQKTKVGPSLIDNHQKLQTLNRG